MQTWKIHDGSRPSAANGASRTCSSCSSLAIAYIEMPEENTVISRERERVERPRLFVETQPQVFGDRTRPRAVVERHHEDAEEHHRGNCAHPVEMAGRDPVFRARRAHADDFLRAEVGRQEREAADPRRQRAPRLKEVGARLGVALQRHADADDEREIDENERPVERREGHESASVDANRAPKNTAEGSLIGIDR